MRLRTAILLVALAAAGSAWAATNAARRTVPVTTVFTDSDNNWLASVWRDPDTGCEYLIRGDTMVPRKERGGYQRCT